MNNLLRTTLFAVFLLLAGQVFAQVGIGILTPDTSAILHLESTDRGFLLPRMTTAQRTTITTPADGLMIYNIEDSVVQYWNGMCWLDVYMENCTDCYFDMSLSSNYEILDRTVSDSVFTDVNVVQTAGTPSDVAISVMGALPPGMTFNISTNPVTPPGVTTVSFHADPFTPAGTYVFVIQGLCGGDIENHIFTIEVEPCYIVEVDNSIDNYVMTTDFYATYPSAPTTSPVCVVNHIFPGVTVGSPSTADPAYTTGTLPAGSVLGIINEGMVIGRGGDGGVAYDPIAGVTGEGFPGGHAMNIEFPATINNTGGYLFGGGGGGASMAFGVSYTVPMPWPIPDITFGFFVGSGGGGGAGLGQGGNYAGAGIGFFYYTPGSNATGGLYGLPGDGGVLNTPINFAVSLVTITINPNTVGGDGGQYGYPGQTGVFQLTLSITANLPIIGPVTIVNNLNIPIPVPAPPGGDAGYAIKRNGNSINIIDNWYNTSFIKGRVGN